MATVKQVVRFQVEFTVEVLDGEKAEADAVAEAREKFADYHHEMMTEDFDISVRKATAEEAEMMEDEG